MGCPGCIMVVVCYGVDIGLRQRAARCLHAVDVAGGWHAVGWLLCPLSGVGVIQTLLSVCYECEEKVFFVVGIGLDVDFAFTGKPADCGECFFVFEFCDFFELFEAECVCFIEGLPYEAGRCSDCFCVHNLSLVVSGPETWLRELNIDVKS